MLVKFVDFCQTISFHPVASTMGFLYSQFLVTPSYPNTSFSGQTIIVTGSNVGLGLEAARHFARLGAAKIILAVRNVPAGEKAKESIESSTKRPGVCEVWKLDLASYESVKAFAQRASQLPRLDVLLENAGIATGEFTLAEGHERTVTVNVISTFLLALLVLPKLKSTAKEFNKKTNLTIVTSEVHAWCKFPEHDAPNSFAALDDDSNKTSMKERYPVSKLLEVLGVREMAPRLKDSGLTVNMLNPGLCHSELARDSGWVLWLLKLVMARSTEVGSRTLVASAAAGEESHGAYMSDAEVANEALGGFMETEGASKAQKKIWRELGEILEDIQPGIMKSI